MEREPSAAFWDSLLYGFFFPVPCPDILAAWAFQNFRLCVLKWLDSIWFLPSLIEPRNSLQRAESSWHSPPCLPSRRDHCPVLPACWMSKTIVSDFFQFLNCLGWMVTLTPVPCTMPGSKIPCLLLYEPLSTAQGTPSSTEPKQVTKPPNPQFL